MIVKILSVSLLTLVLSSCSSIFKIPCESIELAAIFRADTIEIIDQREALSSKNFNGTEIQKRTKYVIGDSNNVKSLISKITEINNEWYSVITTSAVSDFLLIFYDKDKVAARVFLNVQALYSGGCVKAFSKNDKAQKIYDFVKNKLDQSTQKLD